MNTVKYTDAYWRQRDFRAEMERSLYRLMTEAEKQSYVKCDASFKKQDKLYRKLAEKYGVKFVEYPAEEVVV